MPQDDLEAIGATRVVAALNAREMGLLKELAELRLGSAVGVRLKNDPILSQLLACNGGIDAIARARLGESARPVRALLFDKTQESNWALGWHQDRVIAVRERRDVAGFGPWSCKAGIDHVEPPFETIARMITLRAYLDACDAENAPLLIVKGSHRLGRIPSAEAASIADRFETQACFAQPGDVWVYSTAVLHASEPSRRSGHRRVLQVDYAAFDLPAGLKWLGV